MKKLILIPLSLVLLLNVNEANSQESSENAPNFSKLDASPMDLAMYRDENNNPVARIIYSRPQKRDREVFGKLVPYGEVWRTGANESTELTLYEDMKVADEVIEEGTYTLYTIPEEKEWTVILSKETHTWGAYEYADRNDVVRINVPVRQTPNTIEAFSMAFERAENGDGANLLFGWDDSYVKVPFRKAE